MKYQDITYRSAVDVWLAIVVAAAVLAPIVEGIRLLNAGDQQGWVLIAVSVFGVMPILAVAIPCRYTLTDRSVIVRCGVGNIIEHKIKYGEIESVSRTWNPCAAPAWSLRRVKIKMKGGFWRFALVSPVNRDRFIEELNRRRKLDVRAGPEGV